MLAEASSNDLKQILKAYRNKVEARKATKFGSAERSISPGASNVARDLFTSYEQTAFSEPGSLQSGRCGALPAPQLATGEVLQPRFSPSLDLNTPVSPVSNARAYMLNASLSEPGASAPSPQPLLKEPTNSQRPVQASPKGQGIGFVQYQDRTPSQTTPFLLERDAFVPQREPEIRSHVSRAGLSATVSATSGLVSNEGHILRAQSSTQTTQTTQNVIPTATQSHVATGALCGAQSCQAITKPSRPTLPLPRASGAAAYTMEEDRVLRRLQQVRAAITRCDEEIRDLTQESESENGTTKVSARDTKLPWHFSSLDPHQVEQELFECKKRVARLEQLNKLHTGWGAEEAPSDASTSASLGADDTWQQRAEVLRDELQRQAAIAIELQDRIHWLREQLRRQPGLQDKRMQEVVVLLVELAEILPRDERVVAIGEILGEIAHQASFAKEPF